MDCDIWSKIIKDIEDSVLLSWITCSGVNQLQYYEDTPPGEELKPLANSHQQRMLFANNPISESSWKWILQAQSSFHMIVAPANIFT